MDFSLSLIAFILMCCFKAATCTHHDADITSPPQSVNTTLNGVAHFSCTYVGDAFRWKANGTKIIDDGNSNGYTFTESELSQGLHLSTLTVVTTLDKNNTNITCTAIAQGSDSIESEPALLLLQGLLESVSNLNMISSNSTTVLISWSPPFTLEGVPILGYTVTITNTTSGENETMLVEDTSHNTLLYPIEWDPVPENNFTVTVVPFNDVGAGKLSKLMFKILPVAVGNIFSSMIFKATTSETPLKHTIHTISLVSTTGILVPPSTGPSGKETGIAVGAVAAIIIILVLVICVIIVAVVRKSRSKDDDSGKPTAQHMHQPPSVIKIDGGGAPRQVCTDSGEDDVGRVPAKHENERTFSESDAVQSLETRYADTEENEERAPPSGTNPLSYATSPGVAHEPMYMYDNTRHGARKHVPESTTLPKQQMEPESEKGEPHQGADADAVADAVAVADPEADADASSEVENSLPVHVNVHEAENEIESDAVQSLKTRYDTDENEERALPSGTNLLSYATIPGVAHEPMYDNTSPGARKRVTDDPLNEPPNMIDLLDRVASRAIDKWRVLGLKLNIPYHQLQSIERDERYPDLCFLEVFNIWERNSDSPFTWATIVEALRSPIVGEKHLAREIEDWLKYR